MNELLSIIIPSFNMEKYLPKCLGSLTMVDARLLQVLDVIVVNDGSKDRTSEIAHEFEAKYPGVIRVIDKANGNYGSCINAGLSAASGKYVKILDADDTYDTRAFADYLSRLVSMPDDTDMVMNDYVLVDEADALIETESYQLPVDVSVSPDELVRNKCQMAMHAVAYRTSLLRDLNYKQTEGISYTDTEWFFLPAGRSKSIRYIPQPVYRYLLGRAGQTMEKTACIKNLWMMERVFSYMLSQYDTMTREDSPLVYFEYQLRRMFSIILDLHCEVDHRLMVAQYFRGLSRTLSKYPFLLPSLRDKAIFARSPYGFYYHDFLVRHPAWTRPVLALVDLYKNLRSKI